MIHFPENIDEAIKHLQWMKEAGATHVAVECHSLDVPMATTHVQVELIWLDSRGVIRGREADDDYVEPLKKVALIS